MNTLVSLSKADMKRLGIVSGKNGILIDKNKLAEIKKFSRKESDDPQKQAVIKQVSTKEMVKEAVNQKDSDIGIF